MNRITYLRFLFLTLIISASIALGISFGISQYISDNMEWNIKPESIKENKER